MKYGELVSVFEDHHVSAAEAAYGTLLCLFMPGKIRRWVETVPADILQHQPEEWHIESMDALILDSSRTQYEGRPMGLFTHLGNLEGQAFLPARPVQYMGKPVCLIRPVDVKHGVGLYLASPAYLENDNIVVNLSYRVVYHD